MTAREISNMFATIYYYCHPHFSVSLSHSSVRALHYIAMNEGVTIRKVAEHLGCAHNTASEIVSRLTNKNLVTRERRKDDERVVDLTLTLKGKEILEEQTGLDMKKLDQLLLQMSAEEKEAIYAGFSVLLASLKKEIE